MTPGTAQAPRCRARFVLAIGVCFGLGYLHRRSWRAVAPAVATGLHTLARLVYTLGTPVLWGTLLMVGACLWRARRQHQPRAGTSVADYHDNS